MSIFRKLFIKYWVRPRSHLDFCNICSSWNPWHHPYTIHTSWCPRYQAEADHLKSKNRHHYEAGSIYEVGWPEDNIWDELEKLYRK